MKRALYTYQHTHIHIHISTYTQRGIAMKRNIIKWIEHGNELKNSVPAGRDDLTLSETQTLLQRARREGYGDTDALVTAIMDAYAVGYAVGYKRAGSAGR